ncbi:GTPase HflX [Chitinispirillales bacterium ANBcel5]|uniref:GTPase HflX n=1 Tax=Cellulosispirillum alkaliphilum TaxID=3039283 RepID=UPI002A4EEBDC|nr:GTPase HflX [Chitinispirillales bacterium ANBcel5]
MIENKTILEKVVVAGLQLVGEDKRQFDEDMQEMVMLCQTAGAEVVSTIIQKKDRPMPSTFLGEGKLKEIRTLMRGEGVKTLVVDAQLSPGQVRNIENTIKGKVLDRGQLILDIFALHAKTVEAKVQVELAQMRTLYPRLTHAWTHFSQQVGGIGTRGPGETQLEVDRRLVQKRITDLKARLKKIEKNRKIQSKRRDTIFRASLVGYTNVGKSSLLNALSGSEILVENKLFATLDTSTRRTYIPGVGNIVISDTVGFLRKLPHHLVASFRSTLSVVSEAQMLIVVLDASSEFFDQQLATVNSVLHDLGADDTRRLLVFNKIDLVDDPFVKKQLRLAYPDAIFISAHNKEDISLLKGHIAETVIEYEKEKRVENIIMERTKDLMQGSPHHDPKWKIQA